MNQTNTSSSVAQTPSLRVLGGMLLRTFRTWKLERDIAQAQKEHKEGKTGRISLPDDVDKLLG